MSFARDLTSTLVVRFVALGLAFLTNVLVARTLGADGMGAYALIMTTLALMLLVGSAGLESANVYLAGKGRYPLGALVANSCWVALGGAALCAVALWAGRGLVFATVLRGVDPVYAVLGLLALPALLMKVCLQGLLRGMNRLASWNGTVLAEAVLLLAVLAVCVYRWKLGVYGAMVSQLVVAATMALVLLGMLTRAAEPAWIHGGALGESLRYGAKIQASNLLNFFNYRLSFYLLNAFISLREVGQYSVALALLQPVLLISTAVQYVLFPKISSADASAAKAWMPRLLRQMLLFLLAVFALLALASRPLVLWCYGAEYAGAVRPLQVLILGGVFLSLGTVLDAYNCGRGRPDIAIYSAGLAVALTAGLGWWLIPRHGMLGAAWTSVGACAGLMAVELAGYLRLSGNRLADSLVIQADDVREATRTVKEFLKGPLAP